MTATPCPICGGPRTPGWRTRVEEVGRADFRPSSDSFGRTIAPLWRCTACGHASVGLTEREDTIREVYEGVSEADADDEDPGRAATATRDLTALERFVGVGRLVDIGCWTGSLLAIATARGWEAVGIEPSSWAVGQARSLGLDVHQGELGDAPALAAARPFDAATCCDVLEHVADPVASLTLLHTAVRPGGALLATVPDAGSLVARSLRGRWWSVLPMHLHYFTRRSIVLALERAEFEAVHVVRHPKAFSSAYYAGRVAAAVPALRGMADATARSRLSRSTIAPNLHDRLLVVARRT